MAGFDSIFDDVYSLVNATSNEVRLFESKGLIQHGDASDLLPDGPQDEYILQKQIRPIFGKEGINKSKIWTHPDFVDLEQSSNDALNHYVCTFFVDIKSSTRLSLIYDLNEVRYIKNAILQTCIEVIRSLDGYVHRLMGDAVMAYFGGVNINKEDAVANAINCATTLRAILDKSIKPWMKKSGYDPKDLGFRIGFDFGDDENVLWSRYGYSDVQEVTATGLNVDMASKLQSHAPKNEAMLGQSLLEFIDWPAEFSKIKTKNRSGELIKLPIVTPNITNKDGEPLNYSMRQLDYSKMLRISALPIDVREELGDGYVIKNRLVSFKCFVIRKEVEKQYISASHFLNKNMNLRFEVKMQASGMRLTYPLKVVFKKTNYGKQAVDNKGDGEYEKTYYLYSKKINRYDKSHAPILVQNHPESTQYRGLHTMECNISDSNGKTLFRDCIGVLIV